MSEECIHGLESGCTICLGKDRPAPVVVEATFFARFAGHCSSCDLPIHVSQVIHRLSNDRYVHAGCE